MQIAELSITGLFGRYDHLIPLPSSSEDSESPSVVIIHGPNGVGKTTVLQMLDGVMRLDFDTFRRVPFHRFQVQFSTGEIITTEKMHDGTLGVTFRDHEVYLSATEKGPAAKDQKGAVDNLRTEWNQFVQEISFEFLDDSRMLRRMPWLVDTPADVLTTLSPDDLSLVQRYLSHSLLRDKTARGKSQVLSPRLSALGERVRRFMQEAQLDYRPFFQTTEPDLFPRILENLSNPQSSLETPEVLEKKLRRIHERDQTHARLGLGQDRWDYERLLQTVHRLRAMPDDNSIIVLNTYTEFLESRSEARQLVADRLVTFERVMDEFFEDKTVRIDRTQGIRIASVEGESLEERQLSSGEYQLLYLMVAALTTRRRGTVIAIDEPELSIHIEWQRKLVRNILRCASRATPQLILATHSPDIAGDYAEEMIVLSPTHKKIVE